ncbi:MAG: type II toxin-antitoxin system RelE/ParE family toxin [Candidatus Riflebacteria bacterium]|nr:type II toxin-antitoxin system RelE/ParE family toxin [Candidatus Riflebacteria bacterium]
MGNYRIFATDEFCRRLAGIAQPHRDFLTTKLTTYVYPQLAEEPHFGLNIRKLVQFVPPTWRYRIGRFRVFFTIDDQKRVVFLLSIDHRKDAYK